MHQSLVPVALLKCTSYDQQSLREPVNLALESVRPGENYRGKTVLLKPNLISVTSRALACTHCNVVDSVARWFLDQGAKVVVGDSPAFGSASKVCERHGISQVLKKLGVEIVNFDSSVTRCAVGGTELPVAQALFDCDYFVGLPKIKAHNQMFVSLAMKNIFGIVTGMSKPMLHMIHGSHRRFSKLILDLQSILPPQIHLADGIEVMHRSGPLDGEKLIINCLAASKCPVSLDSALLDVLELDASKSPLWVEAFERGHPGTDGHACTFPHYPPSHFYRSGFVAPNSLNPVRFNPFRFFQGFFKRLYFKK